MIALVAVACGEAAATPPPGPDTSGPADPTVPEPVPTGVGGTGFRADPRCVGAAPRRAHRRPAPGDRRRTATAGVEGRPATARGARRDVDRRDRHRRAVGLLLPRGHRSRAGRPHGFGTVPRDPPVRRGQAPAGVRAGSARLARRLRRPRARHLHGRRPTDPVGLLRGRPGLRAVARGRDPELGPVRRGRRDARVPPRVVPAQPAAPAHRVQRVVGGRHARGGRTRPGAGDPA